MAERSPDNATRVVPSGRKRGEMESGASGCERTRIAVV